MALRQRTYFFDAGNADRFNSQDIPTEQTMSDWCDSVPFIKEITDRAQLTRAGIAKTTTDAKINTGDNTDAAGVSPLGFTSFVRPAQIPKILNSPSVTWTKVARGGATNTDTGVGIEDWQATVQFSTPPNQDADQITSTDDLEISRNDGLICSTITSNSTILPVGTDLQTILTTMQDAIRSITDRIPTLSLVACRGESGQVELGDVVMSVTSSGSWSDKWLEPNGNEISISAYPDLYALIGFNYGVPSTPGFFKLPNLVSPSEQNYLRARTNTGFLLPGNINGGSFLRTLGDTDIPDHNHTFSTTTLPSGDHNHTVNVYPGPGSGSFIESDGDGGTPNTTNTNNAGTHSHTVTGTTDLWGEVSPDPVWNTNTNVTPRYTNVYLKMRVKL